MLGFGALCSLPLCAIPDGYVVMQCVLPIADIASGQWKPSVGTDLYAMLDEAVRDDSDFIFSPTNPVAEQFEVLLAPIADPMGSNRILKLALIARNQDTHFDFDLVQGVVVLDSWTEFVTAGEGAVLRAHALSALVESSITDYADLRVRGVARA